MFIAFEDMYFRVSLFVLSYIFSKSSYVNVNDLTPSDYIVGRYEVKFVKEM